MLQNAFDLGPHAFFIWSAYGVTALCLAVLTISVVGADRRQRRLMAALETRGITRRSATKSSHGDRKRAPKPEAASPPDKPKSKAAPKSKDQPQSQVKRGLAKRGQAKAGASKAGQVNGGQVKGGQVRPGQATPGAAAPGKRAGAARQPPKRAPRRGSE